MNSEELNSISQEEISAIKKKSVTGAISYFARSIFLQGIALGAAILLSAFLDPEDFGIYGFVIQIIGILTFLSDVGLAAALIQKKHTPSKEEYQTVFTVQQILAWIVVFCSIILILSGWVFQKTGEAGVWILLSLAISFPLASLKTIPSVILERNLDFSKLVIPNIVEQIIFYTILVFMAWKGYGAIAYAYAICARSALGTLIMLYIQPWTIGLRIDRTAFQRLFSYGFTFQLNDFLARIKDQLFYLALGTFLPLREFGYISWAKQWSHYPYTLTVQNVMAITFPTFSRLQHNNIALSRAIEKTIYFITLIIFPMIVGMSVFIYPLLTIVPEYQKWSPATLSLILFTLHIGWGAISSPLTNTLNAIGEIAITLRLMIFWTVLTWVLTPLAIFWFGYNGVAIATFVISFSSFLPILYVKRFVNISFIDQIWRQAAASVGLAVVGLAGMQLWSESLWTMFLGMVLSAITYVVLLLVLGKNKLVVELLSLRKVKSK